MWKLARMVPIECSKMNWGFNCTFKATTMAEELNVGGGRLREMCDDLSVTVAYWNRLTLVMEQDASWGPGSVG